MLESILNTWSICVFLITLLFILLWKSIKKPDGVPPGPPVYLPVLGNLFDTDQRTVLSTYRKYRQLYGDIFSIKMGTRLVIVLNGYKTLNEAFVKNADVFSDRPNTFVFRKLEEGHGVTCASGEIWKAHRTFALKVLRVFGFGKRSLEPQIMKEVKELSDALKQSQGQPFDIFAVLKISISNIICALVFGERYNHGDERILQLMKLIDENFKYNGHSGLLNFLPFLEYVPGDPFKATTIINNRKNLEDFFIKVVEEHRKTFEEQNIRDYVDAFLLEMKYSGGESKIYTDKHLLKTIYTFFSAGTETTVTAITWAILFFIHHPDVQTKLRKEIKSVVGTSDPPEMEHRSELPYCEAVITEILRCGNIGPLALPHGVSKDVIFKGYSIPKDAIILANLDSVMTDPELFQNPAKFDPDRFIDQNGKLHGTEMVIAFSLGRRVCLAESLARMELFLFLTSLIQQFEFLPVEGQPLPPLDDRVGLTRTPAPFLFRAIHIQT